MRVNINKKTSKLTFILRCPATQLSRCVLMIGYLKPLSVLYCSFRNEIGHEYQGNQGAKVSLSRVGMMVISGQEKHNFHPIRLSSTSFSFHNAVPPGHGSFIIVRVKW